MLRELLDEMIQLSRHLSNHAPTLATADLTYARERMEWLGDEQPELMQRYEELYARGAYAPREERERLAGVVRDARRGRLSNGRREGIAQSSGTLRFRLSSAGAPKAKTTPDRPIIRQGKLF